MDRQPFARVGAWLVDVLCLSGWVAVLAAIGLGLYVAGAVQSMTAVVGNLVSFLVLVLPVTLALGRAESGGREATIGKRARRLRVVDARTQGRVPFGRALLRNAVKVALPWTLGHVVVYGLSETSSDGTVPPWLVVATAFAYALPVLYVATLFFGDGRTPYDRLAGTVVVRLAETR